MWQGRKRDSEINSFISPFSQITQNQTSKFYYVSQKDQITLTRYGADLEIKTKDEEVVVLHNVIKMEYLKLEEIFLAYNKVGFIQFNFRCMLNSFWT